MPASMEGPISGRLPMDYGVEEKDLDAKESKQSGIWGKHSESKENAASCPHPAANQNEGPAGRKDEEMGSKIHGVKEGHFNEERARAANLGRGRK